MSTLTYTRASSPPRPRTACYPGDATVDALRVTAAAAGLTLGGLLFGDFVHDTTAPQQPPAASEEGVAGGPGAAAAAGQEEAVAPAAAKRKTRAKAKSAAAAEGEGTAAATGPARFAPGEGCALQGGNVCRAG